MVAKHKKVKKGISLSSKEKRNYFSDIKDKTYLN